MKKISALIQFSLLYCGIQVVLVACGCDQYYSVFRYVDEPELMIGVKTASADSPIRVVDSGEVLSGDSILVELSLDAEFVEDVELSSLQRLVSTTTALSCEKGDLEMTDSIIDFDIFTLDTFNQVQPNQSLLRSNGVNDERKSTIIRENTVPFKADFKTELWLIEKPENGKVGIGAWIAMASGDTLRTTFVEVFWK